MKVTGRSVVGQLVDVVHKYFLWAIVSSYIVAAFLSRFGLWIGEVDVALLIAPQGKNDISLPPPMLAMLVFNAGLGLVDVWLLRVGLRLRVGGGGEQTHPVSCAWVSFEYRSACKRDAILSSKDVRHRPGSGSHFWGE